MAILTLGKKRISDETNSQIQRLIDFLEKYNKDKNKGANRFADFIAALKTRLASNKAILKLVDSFKTTVTKEEKAIKRDFTNLKNILESIKKDIENMNTLDANEIEKLKALPGLLAAISSHLKNSNDVKDEQTFISNIVELRKILDRDMSGEVAGVRFLQRKSRQGVRTYVDLDKEVKKLKMSLPGSSAELVALDERLNTGISEWSKWVSEIGNEINLSKKTEKDFVNELGELSKELGKIVTASWDSTPPNEIKKIEEKLAKLIAEDNSYLSLLSKIYGTLQNTYSTLLIIQKMVGEGLTDLAKLPQV